MTIQFSQSVSGGGMTIQPPPINVQSEHPNPFNIDVPAGLLGELTARVDANTGTVTVASGHGITTSHLVDIYTAAGVLIRKDMTVTGTTGTTVVVNAGSGSDLPALNDAVVISRQQPAVTLIDNTNLDFFSIYLDTPVANGQFPAGRVIFEEADDSDVVEIPLVANQLQIANILAGQANPLAGNAIAKCRISNGNTVAAKLKMILAEDPTP